MKAPKVYLAGPMSGYKDFNFPAFFKAAETLRAAGYEVFSPAEADLERVPGDWWKGPGNVEQAEKAGLSLREALAVDMEYICRQADAIALIPGWEHSSGARTEWSLANCLRLPIIYLTKEDIV